MRKWRNWQTRTFEGRVVLPYGFKSRLPHQNKKGHRMVSFFVLVRVRIRVEASEGNADFDF